MNGITTTQTIGPFPHEAWRWAFAPQTATGDILICGRVLDGDDQPVGDAILEAYALGLHGSALPHLLRVPTNEAGEFTLNLPAPASGEPAALVTVFARGLLKHQFTAILLATDSSLDRSPLLAQVPESRRITLLAHREPSGRYRWDLRLQGDQETVFFDFE
jgi:protocatechuate 3,4-dioxygenase alpha subunit